MNTGERILALIDHHKVSKNKFATQMLGLVNGTKLDHLIKGRNDITPEFAKMICSAIPEISYIWLLKGEGEMFKEDTTNDFLNTTNLDVNELAITVLKYEDQLLELPLFKKMIERHSLRMLNDKIPELMERLYKMNS